MIPNSKLPSGWLRAAGHHQVVVRWSRDECLRVLGRDNGWSALWSLSDHQFLEPSELFSVSLCFIYLFSLTVPLREIKTQMWIPPLLKIVPIQHVPPVLMIRSTAAELYLNQTIYLWFVKAIVSILKPVWGVQSLLLFMSAASVRKIWSDESLRKISEVRLAALHGFFTVASSAAAGLQTLLLPVNLLRLETRSKKRTREEEEMFWIPLSLSLRSSLSLSQIKED